MTKTTEAEAIVDVLARVVPDGGTALAQHHGEAAVNPKGSGPYGAGADAPAQGVSLPPNP